MEQAQDMNQAATTTTEKHASGEMSYDDQQKNPQDTNKNTSSTANANTSDVFAEDESVLAQVQRYQLRHKVTPAGEDSESELEEDSDSDGDEEDDYQVFGRMTIKAQSEAFYQISLEQKENKSGVFGVHGKYGKHGKPLPKFMMRKTNNILQTHEE